MVLKLAIQANLKQGHGNIGMLLPCGIKGSGNNLSYSASKFAVVGMTKICGLE